MEVRKVEKLGNRCNTTQEASKTNKQTNKQTLVFQKRKKTCSRKTCVCTRLPPSNPLRIPGFHQLRQWMPNDHVGKCDRQTDRQTKKKQHQRLYEETYEVGSGSSVSLHEGPQVLEDLGAPIDRTRRRRRTVLVVDNNEAILDGDKVEAEGTHVQEHSRDIQQGGKEEQASPSENRRHEDEDELLHLLLGGRACWGAAAALAPSQPAVPMHLTLTLGSTHTHNRSRSQFHHYNPNFGNRTGSARLSYLRFDSIPFHFVVRNIESNWMQREREGACVVEKGNGEIWAAVFSFSFFKKTKINRNISERKKREILYSILLCLSERMWKCRRRRKREWISAW